MLDCKDKKGKGKKKKTTYALSRTHTFWHSVLLLFFFLLFFFFFPSFFLIPACRHSQPHPVSCCSVWFSLSRPSVPSLRWLSFSLWKKPVINPPPQKKKKKKEHLRVPAKREQHLLLLTPTFSRCTWLVCVCCFCAGEAFFSIVCDGRLLLFQQQRWRPSFFFFSTSQEELLLPFFFF